MTTREEVLARLKLAHATGVSGETLASSLGVSRVAIGKHIAALRALGYEISARPGTGYTLESAPDLAIPTEIAPLVTAAMWTRFEGGLEVASTNDVAKQLARDGAPEGTVVVAASQTQGRGRLGRSWASPQGGAYLSVVLRPGIAPAQAGPLALVVGVGVVRGLGARGVRAGLKWPNDVWLEGRKLAGILLEMNAEHDSVSWVVAGVGLNVRAREDAASVDDVAPGSRVAAAAAAVLDGIASAYEEWRACGFTSLLDEFRQADVLAGQQVVVSSSEGSRIAAGVARGVDAEGRLLVEGADGHVIPVYSGDVTLRT